MPTICETCQMKFNCPEYLRSIISESAYWDLECKAEECEEKKIKEKDEYDFMKNYYLNMGCLYINE